MAVIALVALLGGVGVGLVGKGMGGGSALGLRRGARVGDMEAREFQATPEPEPAVDGGSDAGTGASTKSPNDSAPGKAAASCETLPQGSSKLFWNESTPADGPPAGFETAKPASQAGCRSRVAFHKTHKTGSATIAGTFFQSSVCSKCTLFEQPRSGGVLRLPPVEWMLKEMRAWPDEGSSERLILHTSGTGEDAAGPFSLQKRWITGEGGGKQAMVPGGALVTSLREPVSRWLSHQLYFQEPAKAKTAGAGFSPAAFLLDAAKRCSGANVMAKEFGLTSAQAVSDFVRDELPRFGGLVLLEDLARSMVLTALRLRLRPEDLLYFVINSSKKKGEWMSTAKGIAPLSKEMKHYAETVQPPTAGVSVGSDKVDSAGADGWEVSLGLHISTLRWDYLRVLRTPSVSKLGPKLAAKILACNPLDQQLYEGAQAQVQAWADMAAEDGGRFRLGENVERFQRAVDAVTDAVRERLVSATDRRPAMSNVRTSPDQFWMGLVPTISLSGLLTMNELDRNGFIATFTRALHQARGSPKAAAYLSPGVSVDLHPAMIKAYEGVCALRDEIVAEATGGTDAGGGTLGFACDAPTAA